MKLKEFLKNFAPDEKFAVKLRTQEGQKVEEVFLADITNCLDLNICHFEKVEDVILLTVVKSNPKKLINKEKLPIMTLSMFNHREDL